MTSPAAPGTYPPRPMTSRSSHSRRRRQHGRHDTPAHGRGRRGRRSGPDRPPGRRVPGHGNPPPRQSGPGRLRRALRARGPRLHALAGAHRGGSGRRRQPAVGRFARYFGLRTRVLDDFVLRSAGAGARQVVLLGAGLDTRAFRLDLPSDCVVFEIDRAGVLAFKEQVLTGLSAAPEVKRVPVPVDLREDWAARSAPWVSTPPHPASGWPRDCSSTCRVPPRRTSSTRWTG